MHTYIFLFGVILYTVNFGGWGSQRLVMGTERRVRLTPIDIDEWVRARARQLESGLPANPTSNVQVRDSRLSARTETS